MVEQATLYASLDTPVVLLDLNKLQANIDEMQQAANETGVKLRPHAKHHQSVEIAKMQLKAGACGIEIGPIEQAEPMADGGIDDIVAVYPFYGEHKLETLKRLLKKPNLKLTVVVDMFEQAEGISRIAQTLGRKVPVLIKIDTGVDRYGVLPGAPTLNLAKKIGRLGGVEIVGITSHESPAQYKVATEESLAKAAFEVLSQACETARLLTKEGFCMRDVSLGATPTFRFACRYLKEGKFPEITEIHPGGRVLGDMAYVRELGTTKDKCALTVLVSVMSTSHPNHVVVDAGGKTFGAEVIFGYRETPGFFWKGRPSYGSVQGHEDLWFGRLAAETSCLYYMDSNKKLRLGERLQIVPNSCVLVFNLHDKVYGVRDGVVEREILVTGRGHGN